MLDLQNLSNNKKTFIIFKNDILNSSKWVNAEGLENQAANISLKKVDDNLRTLQWGARALTGLKINPNYDGSNRKTLFQIAKSDEMDKIVAVRINFFAKPEDNVGVQYLEDGKFMTEQWDFKTIYETFEEKQELVYTHYENKLNNGEFNE